MNQLKYLALFGFLTLNPGAYAHEFDHRPNFGSQANFVGSISTKGLSQSDYPKAAKISSRQACKIATGRMSGSIHSIDLENEEGFLVYTVEIVNPASGLHEVLVDAGNGKLLNGE